MADDFDWSDETIAQMRALWSEGHSTAEIGRRMGTSKNAVVGKAHRIFLPPRPSPIRAAGSDIASRETILRAHGPTLPPLASLVLQVQRAPQVALTAPAPAPIRAYVPPARECCWPLGEPGTRGFRFCCEQSKPGKPYCDGHTKIAYVRGRHRREAEAA